jgi:hypothetical protein
MKADSAWSRMAAWLRYAPAERMPLVSAPVVWTASEILHAAGVSALLPGGGALAAAGIAYGIGEKHAHAAATGHPRLHGAELAAVTGLAGAWATAATLWGPLAGPYDLLTSGGLAAAGCGYWWLRRHEAIRAARKRRGDEAAEAAAWRERKAAWHRLAAQVGLIGSHLLRVDPNNNGETWVIDTYSSRQLASQVNCDHVAQKLAGELGKRKSRIEVCPDPDWAYQLTVGVRESDPWKGGSAAGCVWHPYVSGAYDPQAPYAGLVPEAPTIRDPITFGVDPETGAPLQVPLWTPNGAQRVLVVATSGAGKSMTLDDICERITACPDARLLQINLSKGIEDSWWAPLAEASALAGQPDAASRALRMLDFVYAALPVRAQSRRAGVRTHQPTAAEPLLVLKVDEVDKVANDQGRKEQLAEIASKCRSEGIALILGAQRPVNQWIGGAGVRANLSYIVWGKMRTSDTRHAAGGESIALPDIGSYGGNNPGVFGVAEHPTYDGMPFSRGRSFHWGEDSPGLVRLVAARAAERTPYVLEPGLASLAEDWAAITGTPPVPAPQAAAEPGPAAGAAPADRYDLITRKNGQTIRGVAVVTARIATAADIGTAPVTAPDLTAGDEARLADVLDQQRREFLGEYTGESVDLPGSEQAALRAMLATAEGVSIRQAAGNLAVGRDRVHRQLTRWESQGTAEVRGKGGRDRRWHAAERAPGDRATTYPGLHAVPGGGAAAAS